MLNSYPQIFQSRMRQRRFAFIAPSASSGTLFYRAADVDPLVGRKWKAKKKHSHGLTRNYTEKKKTPVPELAEGVRLARIHYPHRLCQLCVCEVPILVFNIHGFYAFTGLTSAAQLEHLPFHAYKKKKAGGANSTCLQDVLKSKA